MCRHWVRVFPTHPTPIRSLWVTRVPPLLAASVLGVFVQGHWCVPGAPSEWLHGCLTIF